MPHYIALDVSQKTTAICVVHDQGRRLGRGVCDTDPGVISARVLEHARVDVRVGVETGSMTPWLVHGLRSAGLDVQGLDAPRDLSCNSAPALPTRWVHRLARPAHCQE